MIRKYKTLFLFIISLLVFQSFLVLKYQDVVKAETIKSFTQNTAYPPSIGDTYINPSDGLTYTVTDISNKKVSAKVGIEYGYNYYARYVDTANVTIPNPTALTEYPSYIYGTTPTPWDGEPNNMKWGYRENTNAVTWDYQGFKDTVSLPAANFWYRGSDPTRNYLNFWNVPSSIDKGSDNASRDGSAPPPHTLFSANAPNPDSTQAYYMDENNIQYPVTMSSITTAQKSYGIYIENPANGFKAPYWTQECEVYADDYFVTLTATVYTVTYTYSANSTVTVKYVDQATNEDISPPDIYTDVAPGEHTYNAKVISGYTLQGPSTQAITVVEAQSYVVTFYYKNDSASSTVTVKYVDQATGKDISPPDIFSNVSQGDHTYYAKVIEGYTVQAPSIQTITVVEGQSYTVIFNYLADPPGMVIIKYQDTTGVKLLDDKLITDVAVGNHTYDAEVIDGYVTPPSQTVYVHSEETTFIIFTYEKVIKPPVVELHAPDSVHCGQSFNVDVMAFDPQGLPITIYWTVSDGQKLSDYSGSLIMGTSPITITVYAINSAGLKSNLDKKTVIPLNNPPEINISMVDSIPLGDDVNYTINYTDPDGDSVVGKLTSHDSAMIGTFGDTSGTFHFEDISTIGKTYSISAKATDQWGVTATATVKITVLAPIPSVSLLTNGRLIENRKISLLPNENSGSKIATITTRRYEFYDSLNNKLTLDSIPNSANYVKTLDSLTDKNIDFLSKQATSIIVKYTITNNFGYSATTNLPINIAKDIIPIAKFTLGGSPYANPNDRDSQGIALITRTLNDTSISLDGDSIKKKIYLYTYDSNNNYKFDEDWYVYNNNSWMPLSNFTTDGKGTWDAIQNLDISKINDENLNQVTIKSPDVGKLYYYEITQEYFTDTIPELLLPSDYKISDLTDIMTMPIFIRK